MNTQSLLNESWLNKNVQEKTCNKVGKDWPFRRYRV